MKHFDKDAAEAAQTEQNLAHNAPETPAEVQSAITDAEFRKVADAYKWALMNKTKREIIGLCIELHVKYEYLKYQLEQQTKPETK